MEKLDLLTIRKQISKFLETGVADSRILQLLQYQDGFVPKECELWDYKLKFSNDSIPISKTILQIVSFYNTYGGYILYGIQENNNDVFKPIGIDDSVLDIHQLMQLLKSYTGKTIDLSYIPVQYNINNNTFNFGILFIPKRPIKENPIFFGKNGPEYKPNKCMFYKEKTYIRINDNCTLAETSSDLQLLFSERINPNLKDLNTAEPIKKTEPIYDHNLPNRNFICPNFIGREEILDKLWEWLGNEVDYFKVLAGDGGKGKTSIAYEFALKVSRVRPFDLEKIIWVTAKKKQFVALTNKYVSVPETHYYDLESLLRALCADLAILDDELEGASIPLLKKYLKEGLSNISALLIIDDIDSTDLDQQKMILEMAAQLSNISSRILLTTRMNFSYSSATCITVGGLEYDDYCNYLESQQKQLDIPKFRKKDNDDFYAITDGSPLYTESLLRLLKLGVPLRQAFSDWKNKLGSEVRTAALKREIDKLSVESRRFLLACSYLLNTSFTEMKQATGFNNERLISCMDELQSLFLISAPEFIEKEPRFSVSNNTANLVLENKDLLVTDPNALKRIVSELRKGKERLTKKYGDKKRVGEAVNQTMAFIKDNQIDDAIATVDAAIKEIKNDPDLLLLKGRCFFSKYKIDSERSSLNNCRKAYKKAYSLNQRKDILYDQWYEAEIIADHPHEAAAVANLAIEDNIGIRSEWYVKCADAYYKTANAYWSSLNYDSSIREYFQCASNFSKAILSSPSYEKPRLKEILYEVHDNIINLLLQTSSSKSVARIMFSNACRFINNGDRRISNFELAFNSTQKIFTSLKDYDKINHNSLSDVKDKIHEIESLYKSIITPNSEFISFQQKLLSFKQSVNRIIEKLEITPN